MSTKFLSVLAALSALFAAACDNASEKYDGNVSEPGRITLAEGGSASLSFPAEGASLTVVFESNLDWTAKCPFQWVSIDPASGSAGQTCRIDISAGTNTASEPRTATVRLSAGAFRLDINIEQAAQETDPGTGGDPGSGGDPGDDPGDDPGSGGDPVPADGDELPCPAPPAIGTVDPEALVGYGAGVTGGAGASDANILHFDNGKALQTWLLARAKAESKGEGNAPVIIWLSGTFVPGDGRDFSASKPIFDVKRVSNLSFIGTDGFVMDRIGFMCVEASNIIIRNINFRQPKADDGADAVSMQKCDGVWVDHCTFTSLNQTKDYEDGSCDITHQSKNVTVSWCRFVKTQKSCLVGHSNSASGDTEITVTFHHNWFDGSSSRHPRVRYGRAHVYNNLYDGCTTYGAGSAYGAKVLVEYNYFDGVQLPTDICTYPAKDGDVSNLQGSVAGYLYATQNVYVNKPAKARSPYPLTNVAYQAYGGTAGTPLAYSDFQPSYSYTVTAAGGVPEVVKANAGYGKMSGYTEAPIAVNNGGITDFDPSDPDPVDPDPDDPENPGDDPSTPAEGLSQGWSWVNNGASSASYSLSGSQLTVSSTGKWESGKQNFSAVYREVSGDFTATVRLVSFEPAKESNQGLAGLIVASDMGATANNLVFALSGASLGKYYSRYRLSAGTNGGSKELAAPVADGSPTEVVLSISRSGNDVSMSYSLDGGKTFGTENIQSCSGLGNSIKLGLAVNSADNAVAATAVFSNFYLSGNAVAF